MQITEPLEYSQNIIAGARATQHNQPITVQISNKEESDFVSSLANQKQKHFKVSVLRQQHALPDSMSMRN